MNTSIHSAAPHQLPIFITAPGFTDVLMVVMGVVLIITVLAVGNSTYTSNHDPIVDKNTGALKGFALHVVDATGLVHALLMRIQALLLPVKTLVLSGHQAFPAPGKLHFLYDGQTEDDASAEGNPR